jgi:hypothetical protein
MADGDPLILGRSNNQSTNGTRIIRGPGSIQPTPALMIDNRRGVEQGLLTFSNGDGVVATGQNGYGVVGISLNSDGVNARGTRSGVTATCDTGPGVMAQSNSGPGVVGQSGSGAGVNGGSHSGPGVSGTSDTGRGVTGESSSGVGVWGQCDFPGRGIRIVGFGSRTAKPNGMAGVFYGSVTVSGDFVVVNGAKNAAIRHRDGSHRLLYSMESPECWFEDFGSSRLVRGKAKVQLHRDFLAVIRPSTHHVFLTPEGNSNGLYIHSKNRSGFEVREQQNGTSTLRFSYRVVARRKDLPGTRFAKVKLPKLLDLSKASRKADAMRKFRRPT